MSMPNICRFAPVCPPRILKGLQLLSRQCLGSYHLLLAHDVAANPQMYRGLFHDDMFIIMDNSVIELGHPVDADTMREALAIVPQTKAIVLPDVMKDKDATIERCAEFADAYSPLLRSDQYFMAVPQGNSLQELQECAWELKHLQGVEFWGVGRFVTEVIGSRKEFLNWLYIHMRRTETEHNRFIHLLGFSDDFMDDMFCSRKLGVMGIDSAVPIRLGQRGQMMEFGLLPHSKRGPTWWDEVQIPIEPATVANLSLVRSWVTLGG
jgi:hypothetical protein